MDKQGFTTTILHNDRLSVIEHGSIHKPVHTAVTYGYADARDLAAVFQGKQSGYRYGRQGNPTVTALEDKITKMEQGTASLCFASGMAAIGALPLGLLVAGDHIICSLFLFGNTHNVWNSMAALGIGVSFVDATNAELVAAAITPSTRMVFVETIANPRTQISDLINIGALCQQRDLLLVVDNTMTSPYLFRPASIGAGLVINALTKAIAGHGDVLGGSITDTGVFDWTKFPNIGAGIKKQPQSMWGIAQLRGRALRDFGACLAPDAAHQIAIGAETMALRLERQCSTALQMAILLEAHRSVARVYYPGLASHAQHELSKQLFRAHGSIFSFELKDSIDCFDFLNQLRVPISATHLGDNRTLVIPVAHTIFFEMGAQRRASMGISESLIRVSVGIEDSTDLLNDFTQALNHF